jgi:6-phosphogluconolactonase (cycloisomerase 2 family)
MQSDDRRSAARWTRREFVRGAAGVVVLPHLPHAVTAATAAPQFAYVASGLGSLDVFRLQGERWTRIQVVPSRAPAFVLLSTAQRTLYVANEVDVHEGLPRGTVESFHIDPFDGRLTLSGRTPLSLSATHPRQMALSPDGRFLAVAAYGGAIYNLFPLAEDGSLRQVSGIFKQAGCGPDAHSQASAHPHTLVFDASGRHLLSSDFGSDRLSIFAVEDGRLERRSHRASGEGSGPGACALHPAGSVFYAWHELGSTLACYRYDGVCATMGDAIQRLSLPMASRYALALHPKGRMLYTAQANPNELRAWHLDAKDGRLTQAQIVPLKEATPSQITATADGESLFILDDQSGSVHKMTADRVTGELHCKAEVAMVNKPKSIALKTI